MCVLGGVQGEELAIRGNAFVYTVNILLSPVSSLMGAVRHESSPLLSKGR